MLETLDLPDKEICLFEKLKVFFRSGSRIVAQKSSPMLFYICMHLCKYFYLLFCIKRYIFGTNLGAANGKILEKNPTGIPATDIYKDLSYL